MHNLDLKKRKYTTITLTDGDKYKIPNEYTVEEVERLLELQRLQEEVSSQEVNEEKVEIQIESLHTNIFDQLEIMFQHYQPEVTCEELRKKITHTEALEMVGFFRKYRQSAINKLRADNEEKKNLN